MHLTMPSALVALLVFSAACGEDRTPATATKQTDFASAPTVGTTTTISVLVANKGGEPIAGIPVDFAAAAGGGSVTPATDTTDATGIATASVTLGTTVGANSVTATIVGLAPVTFSATTVAAAAASVKFPAALTVMNVGGTSTLTPTAKDQYGNTATLPTMTWTSRAATATVASTGQVTGVSAGQAMIVAASSAGSDSTLVIVAPSGGPVLRTDLSSFSVTAGSDQAISVILDMRESTDKLGSTAAKIEWDPAVLTYQSQSAATGGPTAVVNTTAAATGTLMLSMADASGFSGQVTLVKLLFKAGAAGKSGTLKLSTTEVTAATSFTSLTAKTVAASMPIVVR
jgi:hypothetical protein